MSSSAKIFFAVSVLVSGGTIWGVHHIQQEERKTMYQGVIKDDARLAAKRVQRAREAEFSEQARKRAYLEDMQGVSNPATPPVVGMAKVPIPTKEEASQMEFGCTTCEKQV